MTFAERAFQGFDFTARLAYLDITAALGASFDYAFEILEILSKVNESPTPPALTGIATHHCLGFSMQQLLNLCTCSSSSDSSPQVTEFESD